MNWYIVALGAVCGVISVSFVGMAIWIRELRRTIRHQEARIGFLKEEIRTARAANRQMRCQRFPLS